MNIWNVLRRAWQLMWHYRALWLLGALLALTAAEAAHWALLASARDRESEDRRTRVILRRDVTIYLPGEGLVVDFTAPDGTRILVDQDGALRDLDGALRDLETSLAQSPAGISLWPILIEGAVLLAGAIVLGAVMRYVAETALIRMVDEAEETGRQPRLRQGLRAGWSRRAMRLFLLDVCTDVLVLLALALVLMVVVAPIILVIDNRVSIAAGMIGTVVLAIVGGYLSLAAGALASLVVQVARRACVLDDLGLVASIHKGLSLARAHFNDVGAVWLAWMGMRLLWIPLSVVVLVVLFPVMLLSIVAAVVVGAVPGAIVGVIAGLFAGGVTPWIMGAVAGLPFFIVTMVAPLLLVAGPVEVFKSIVWTLAYRGLRVLPARAPVPAAPPALAPAAGA